jgi:hypothetical protein
MGVCSSISFSGSTAILMGKLPKLISFSIHPFFIGFGIHDVLRNPICPADIFPKGRVLNYCL